jgi:hypothetical protein
MQDNTESKRLHHLSEDGQEFVFENDKMYKIKERIVSPDGVTDYIVNEVVSISDIEDRPPYETELIVDRRHYYETYIKPYDISREWYQEIIGSVDELISKGETVLDKKFISDKILDQYLDTEYYIFAHIQDNDWYESIADFIEYNIDSFGIVKGQSSGFGAGVYIGLIKLFVDKSSLEIDRKAKLLKYITPFTDKSLKSEKNCKELIFEAYKTWYNLFPFELSHFIDIKDKYQNNLPILYRIPPRINRFTNKHTATFYTQNDIISFLINETDKLHREFNGTILFEKGLLTDANRNLIELANKTRLLKLEELNEKTPFESTVLEKINHWLKCEKEYINEIKELIEPAPPAKEEIKVDNQWIKDLVKEKYKYYGFEEHIGLNYDFPFMEHKKGDIDFNNQKWASVNWYIRNLNTVHRDLLNNLEMLPKEKVKEQIILAYNKQIEVFQDWDLRQGVYIEYHNTMEEASKLLGSRTPNGYYDIYRLKWLFISACFIKFYKVLLDKYFSEQPEAPAPTATEQQNQKEKSKNVNEVIAEINNAFFRLERFMEGNIDYYDYFGFNDAFTQLFNEVKKPKNYTIENCELIDKYWFLIQQVSFDFDKSEFVNLDAYENEAFCKDCNEMDKLMNRVEEFIYFGGEEEEPKVSINDIIKNKPLSIIGTLKSTPATAQSTNTKEFDNSTLTQIMNMSDSFLEHEERLKLDGYITSENRWIDGRGRKGDKSLEDLANLILLLNEKGYFKPDCRIEGKKKKWKDSDYKKFFEVRYGYKLKEQISKAKKDTQNRLKTAKIKFQYF